MAETRKREKPTPRPPEQRRGSPNRQEHGPQRTAEESNLTHNHVSEPISSRTQQPRWITVQKGETKQPSSTRGAQQEPAHHPPNVGHQRPTGGTNHRATRPNVGHNTRTRAPYSTVLFPPVPVAGLEPARPTGHPLLRRACLPFHHTGIVSAIPHCRGPLVPPVGLEPTHPNGHLILSQACLPIPSRRQKKKGAETNTRDNHATTVRPTSGTHAHQPHHRPVQPACADTLNRPTQTGPTYSPTPRAPWRKHPSATRTHPAHHQCRHTPLRDSTRSREHPRAVSAPRSA